MELIIDEDAMVEKLLDSLTRILGNVFLSEEEFNHAMRAAQGTVTRFNQTASRHRLEIKQKAVGESAQVWYQGIPVTVICRHFSCTSLRKLANIAEWDLYKQLTAIAWAHRPEPDTSN